ncbi:MAG: hybrid sensor histidine kinase/response regulator [Epsilonproteobacteria bacterium]|nr:MAG: hybrid sensor histidine kinase/response regulator [Campylobacterota bacterium]
MKKNTLLIVDDSLSNIDILIEMLPQYDVVDALNASDAFKILELQTVDLILLDIVMPIMDGYDMCKILKKEPKTTKIPIIFISSNNSPEDIQKGFEAGAVDYVTKPFNKLELVSRIKTHLELHEYRENLEKKIEKEIKKSQEKDKMLFQQSKLISMGEMIQNIAHQWRQPLSQINAHVMSIESALYASSEATKKIIETDMNGIESLTQYMSNTINDFKDFFSKDKHKENFNLQESIHKSLDIIAGTLKFHDINIVLEVDENIVINGHKNELQQVILVILNNAKDILFLNKTDNAEITIEVIKIKNQYKIDIIDNAGGIPEKIIDKVFDPYFTTKHETQGTGLGLYIAKMIIESSLDGKLWVENTQDGACFSITLPA